MRKQLDATAVLARCQTNSFTKPTPLPPPRPPGVYKTECSSTNTVTAVQYTPEEGQIHVERPAVALLRIEVARRHAGPDG